MTSKVIFLALAAFFTSSLWAVSFTDPLFEEISSEKLSSEFTQTAALSSSDDLARVKLLQLYLFQAERLELERKIHQALDVLKKGQDKCLSMPAFGAKTKAPVKARGYYTCAILLVFDIDSLSPLSYGGRVQLISQFLKKAASHTPTQLDRLYAEARIYYRLPINFGRKIGKSLLALQFLKRFRPAASSIDYWLGRVYQRQGRHKEAMKAFEYALSRKDTRTKAWFDQDELSTISRHLDGEGWGLGPSAFFSPTLGFGGELSFFDDRVFDTARALRASVLATTKGQYGVRARYRDEALLDFTQLHIAVSAGRFVEEFFGIGIQTPKSARVRLMSKRADLQIAAKVKVLGALSFGLGWRVSSASVESPPALLLGAGLIDPVESFHTGAFAFIEYDSRDSTKATRRGVHARLKGYFPTQGLGSDRSFELWESLAQIHLPFSLKHHSKLGVASSWTGAGAPFAVLPRLGQSTLLPAVRRDRFQSGAVFGAMAEHHFKLFESASFFGFGTTGTVANNVGDLFSQSFKGGFGGGLTYHPNDYYGTRVRVEVGIFAGEFIMRSVGRVNL